MGNKITDLITDALQYDDWEFRINFLVGGLMSYESNDTPEKEMNCNRYLHEISNFCCEYNGSDEQIHYFDKLYDSICKYLDYPN